MTLPPFALGRGPTVADLDTRLDQSERVGQLAENTPEERRRAGLAVCARVADATEAREVLAILGLLGEES